jgi:hypothetical protein
MDNREIENIHGPAVHGNDLVYLRARVFFVGFFTFGSSSNSNENKS